MLFLRRRQHLDDLRRKEALIQERKETLVNTMDSDLERLEQLNKILGNGIGLKLYTVMGGKHGH